MLAPASRRPRSRAGRRGWAVAVALGILLTGLGGLPGSPLPSPRGGGGAPGGQLEVAPAYLPGPGTVDLGPLPAGAEISVAVALASPDPAGLEARLALTYTPGTPQYRAFLSPAAVADAYGAPPATYAAAVGYFTGHGLAVQPSPDRWWIGVRGPAASVASAFHTSFDVYRQDGRTFFSHPTSASLPASLPWAGAVGLGNVSVPRPVLAPAAAALASAAAGCAVGSALHPCNLGLAYNLSSLWSAGSNGTGYRIGVVDAYDGSEPQTTLASDLATFTGMFALPAGGVSYVYPIPTTRNLNATATGWGTEEALDLEWARAMAPGASIDMTFAPDPTTGLYGAVDWLVAHQSVNVLSLSWGEPDLGAYNTFASPCSVACNASSDGSYTLLHPVLVAAALEGIGVFVASGDCGAADGTAGNSTDYPASDPAATGVGGTNLSLTGASGYASESAWSGNALGTRSPGCQNQGGSGGGFAPFARPFWQRGPGLPTTGSNAAARGVPDVSIVGGRPTVDIVYNGFNASVYGTSMSAPMWAGLAAVADQVHGAPLGFLNPSLYAIARGSSAARAFHDVTSGSNGYKAGPGWDPVTGLGSPNASALLPLLAAAALPSPNLTADLRATPRFGPTPLTVTFYPTAASGGSPVAGAAFDVDFGDGTAAWTSAGTVSHRYAASGVFVARAVAFDAQGNSSVSPPIAVVAGGGTALNVTLNASTSSPAVGQSVAFNVSVAGGTAPYTLTYAFGDGTYAFNQTGTTLRHAYGFAGAFCAAVVARDAAQPPDGGLSARVGVAVGGGSVPTCGSAPPLSATLSAGATAFDAPGDVALTVNASGGTPPYSTHFVSDDPYVTACQCGIFHLAGTRTVRAFVNDSVAAETVASLTLTVYPALTGTFTALPTRGVAPLAVAFSAALAGGHNGSAAATRWSFGDGGTAVGAFANHTYSAPGVYLAVADATDPFGGEASRAFLVDVAAAGSGSPLLVSASVAPAVGGPAGTPVAFTAAASGGAGGYLFRWDLGAGGSGFGANLTATFTPGLCAAAGTCPINATLTVLDAAGASVVAPVDLPGAVLRRWSALVLTDSVPSVGGPTPFLLAASANASGMPAPSIAWSFGDGGTAVGPSVLHQYLAAGNFTVTETATDPAGDRLVRTHAITVTGPPRLPPTIAGGPSVARGLAPLTVAFAATASGGAGPPYGFEWAFGDGATAGGPNATHTYRANGTYVANLTVTDPVGAVATASYPIDVYAVTPVTLTFASVANRTVAGATVAATLEVDPRCAAASVPACAAATVAVTVGWRTADGSVNFTAGTAQPNATGVVDLRLTAPTAFGSFELYALAAGPNFTGFAWVPVSVQAPPPPPAGFPFPLVLGAGLVVAVVAGLTALALLRRRRPRVSP